MLGKGIKKNGISILLLPKLTSKKLEGTFKIVRKIIKKNSSKRKFF